jgi:glycerophosphoryl diester phosphodiesterase
MNARPWHRPVLSLLLIIALLAGVLTQISLRTDVRTILVRNTIGFAPEVFYSQLDGTLLDNYGETLAVAHNAGDRIGSMREALRYGADIIEIDVIAVGGNLYAAHDLPNAYFGQVTFHGPSLDSIWNEAVSTGIVKFDLKEETPSFVNLIASFVERHPGDYQLVLASRSPAALERLRARIPQAILLLSISTPDMVASLKANGQLNKVIDGVTIRASLLDQQTAAWLKQQRMVIFAWTVNELADVNALVKLGVTAVTTDNLAIMEILGKADRVIVPRTRT